MIGGRHAALVGSLFLLLAAAGCGETAAPAKRDVVLIVIDTLRADRLGCYGYDRPTSPTIDALAARGVRFEHVLAQSSWTGPSMVSLFQSRRLAADVAFMPPGPTLAERLAAEGYRCVGFQDNILLAPGTGFDRGFDIYEVEAGPSSIEPALKAGDGRPLFAYFHFVDPHDPYEPLPRFDVFAPRSLAADERERLSQSLIAAQPELSPAGQHAAVEAAAEHIAAVRALYDGEVLQADARVEYVLAALRRHGRLDEALVVLAADHGECLWHHREAPSRLEDAERRDLLAIYKRSHNTVLYDSTIRTPLILAGPGVPEGLVISRPVQNVDIVPTMLSLLGLPGASDCEGQDLLPLLAAASAGRALPPPPVRWSNTGLFTAAVSPDGLKLIVPWNDRGADRAQLFDLRSDPQEQTPLPLDSPAARELRSAVERYRQTAWRPPEGEALHDEVILKRMRQLGYVDR